MFQPCVDMQIRCTTCAFLCSCDEELAQTQLTRVEAVATAAVERSCARSKLGTKRVSVRHQCCCCCCTSEPTRR
ncbi:hypothetical protein V8C42DRAFT_312591 [Trichoderma barbatum]